MGDKDKFVAAAKKVRDCADTGNFVTWIEGLSPKGHIDMTWIQEQCEWQTKRLEEQAARDREWRKEEVRLTKDGLRTNVRTMLLSAVIGGAFVLASVALAYSAY